MSFKHSEIVYKKLQKFLDARASYGKVTSALVSPIASNKIYARTWSININSCY